jgi:hypothetical protein
VANNVVKLNLEQVPEVLWMMRQELSRLIRNVASYEDDEDVRTRLLFIANLFEAGVKVEAK